MDSLAGTTICVGRKRAKERNEANERGEPLTVGEIVELTVGLWRQASANRYRDWNPCNLRRLGLNTCHRFFGVRLHCRRLDCATAHAKIRTCMNSL